VGEGFWLGSHPWSLHFRIPAFQHLDGAAPFLQPLAVQWLNIAVPSLAGSPISTA